MDLRKKYLAGLQPAAKKVAASHSYRAGAAVRPQGRVRLEGQRSDACCLKRLDYVSGAAKGNCGIGYLITRSLYNS